MPPHAIRSLVEHVREPFWPNPRCADKLSRAMSVTSSVSEHTPAPCPLCGYDLRGHPAQTRCPECGKPVDAGAAYAVLARWVELCILDQWSICILQTIGMVCTFVSVLAVRQGQYVAVVIGLAAGGYVATATLWYLILLPFVIRRVRRPNFAALPWQRRRELSRWVWINAFLIALLPVAVIVLRRF